MESLRPVFCRPKKHRLLFSGPKSQTPLKGRSPLPCYGDAVWAGGTVFPINRWTARLSLSFPLGLIQALSVALEPLPATDYTV